MNTNPNTKTIICYGDSNTWGAVPSEGTRYPSDTRWTGVLQDSLGTLYEIIEEGLSGRTFVVEDPEKPHRTGITHLHSILKTNKPYSAVVVMLGTNDLKSTFGLTGEEIASHLRQTIQIIKGKDKELNKPTQIIVVCPAPVVNPIDRELDVRLKDAPEMSLALDPLYKNSKRT